MKSHLPEETSMDIKTLEERLHTWRTILWIDTGAVFTLLATGLAELPNSTGPYFPGWYGVWFVIFLASFLPGFLLLAGRRWMLLPLPGRLGAIFGFFALTWFTFLALGIRTGANLYSLYGYFMLGSAAALIGSYGWLRRKSRKSGGEIFP
jgi:hypothetical protein